MPESVKYEKGFKGFFFYYFFLAMTQTLFYILSINQDSTFTSAVLVKFLKLKKKKEKKSTERL